MLKLKSTAKKNLKAMLLIGLVLFTIVFAHAYEPRLVREVKAYIRSSSVYADFPVVYLNGSTLDIYLTEDYPYFSQESVANGKAYFASLATSLSAVPLRGDTSIVKRINVTAFSYKNRYLWKLSYQTKDLYKELGTSLKTYCQSPILIEHQRQYIQHFLDSLLRSNDDYCWRMEADSLTMSDYRTIHTSEGPKLFYQLYCKVNVWSKAPRRIITAIDSVINDRIFQMAANGGGKPAEYEANLLVNVNFYYGVSHFDTAISTVARVIMPS